jgi:hypothetical protein
MNRHRVSVPAPQEAEMSTTSRMTVALRPVSLGRTGRALLAGLLLTLAALEAVAFYHLWPREDGLATYEAPVAVLQGALIHEPETLTVQAPAPLGAPVALAGLGVGLVGLGLFRRRALG